MVGGSEQMPVRATVEPLSWESDFFAVTTARLCFDAAAPYLTPAALAGFDCVQAKVAAGDYARLDALAALGFRLVEGELDLQLNVTEAPDETLPASVTRRLATEQDIPALRAVAAKVFTHSRFRAPWYPAARCAQFYAKWAENAVLGLFDDACLLLERQGQPLGFVTLRRLPAQQARIGLLATWPGNTRQGIGEQLLLSARLWCRQRAIRQLYVATQTSNLPALRLYTRCGAQPVHSACWLYRGRYDSV